MFRHFFASLMVSFHKRIWDWNESRKMAGKVQFGVREISWKMKWLRYIFPERWLYEGTEIWYQLRSERWFWNYLEEGSKCFGRPLSKVEIEMVKKYERQYTNVFIQVMEKRTAIPGLCIDYMFFSEDSRNDDAHVCRLLLHEGEFEGTFDPPNNYLSNKFDEQFQRITRENCSFWYAFLKKKRNKVKIEFTQTYRKRQYYEALRFPENGKPIVHNAIFAFSDKEEKEGKEAVRTLGISEPYICIFARDGRYNAEMRKGSPVERDSVDLRNTDINAFKKMTCYFGEKGIQSVRMGALMEKPYHCEGAIDYSNIGRTEFLDIYVFSKCMFFIGDISGIGGIPIFLGKLVAFINIHVAVHCGDRTEPMTLGIFLKYYDPVQKRYLRWKEWVNIAINYAAKGIDYVWYIRQHYEVIYNTPEEILEVAKEMEMIHNHTMHYTEYDEMLQQRYRDLVKSVQSKFPLLFCPFPGRIGMQWLRDNEWFLE